MITLTASPSHPKNATLTLVLFKSSLKAWQKFQFFQNVTFIVMGIADVIWRFKEWGQLKKHPECVHTMYKSYQFQWSRPWPLWWLDLIRPPSWNAQFLQNSNYLPQRKIHLAWIITWNDLDSGLSQQQFYSASTTCPRNFMAHLRHLAQQHLHGSKEGSHKLNSQIRQTFELIVILTCDCDRESELQSFLFPGLIVLFNKK